MPVVDRAALEDSPLADLHALASELGIDGFRRLRKAQLVDAILEQQGGDGAAAASEPSEPEEAEEPEAEAEAEPEPEEKPKRSRRGGAGRSRRKDADEEPAAEKERPAPAAEKKPAREDRIAEGVVELLGNGSGFVRVEPPEPSDDDVYVSAAQVRRCELVSGDRVTGPMRPPRRSERYPSLVRVDTINGRAADEVAEGTHFEDLPAAFPTQRLPLTGDDPTLKAIAWLTPLGRGSRATIVGPSRAGKTEALRRIAAALAGQDGLELTLALTGVRPEEAAEWKAGALEPAVCLSLVAGADAQAQAVDRALETAKRLAARGGDAVVLIDNLDGLHPHAARRALGAARDIVDGGSLTVIAVSSEPVGGETTVVALDRELTSTGRFPALDLTSSGTLKPELLVGEDGAEAIAQARASVLGVG
jgi:transcription termination factor Rho